MIASKMWITRSDVSPYPISVIRTNQVHSGMSAGCSRLPSSARPNGPQFHDWRYQRFPENCHAFHSYTLFNCSPRHRDQRTVLRKDHPLWRRALHVTLDDTPSRSCVRPRLNWALLAIFTGPLLWRRTLSRGQVPTRVMTKPRFMALKPAHIWSL